jgi:hypothetical protein
MVHTAATMDVRSEISIHCDSAVTHADLPGLEAGGFKKPAALDETGFQTTVVR